jgi:hypothetical protein
MRIHCADGEGVIQQMKYAPIRKHLLKNPFHQIKSACKKDITY